MAEQAYSDQSLKICENAAKPFMDSAAPDMPIQIHHKLLDEVRYGLRKGFWSTTPIGFHVRRSYLLPASRGNQSKRWFFTSWYVWNQSCSRARSCLVSHLGQSQLQARAALLVRVFTQKQESKLLQSNACLMRTCSMHFLAYTSQIMSWLAHSVRIWKADCPLLVQMSTSSAANTVCYVMLTAL